MRGDFMLMASISHSNYINSPMLHHQHGSVIASPAKLTTRSLIPDCQRYFHENLAARRMSKLVRKFQMGKLKEQANADIKWSNEEIFIRPPVL